MPWWGWALVVVAVILILWFLARMRILNAVGEGIGDVFDVAGDIDFSIGD